MLPERARGQAIRPAARPTPAQAATALLTASSVEDRSPTSRSACGRRQGAGRIARRPLPTAPAGQSREHTSQTGCSKLRAPLRRRWRTSSSGATPKRSKRWAAGSGRRRRTHRLPSGRPGCGPQPPAAGARRVRGTAWRADEAPDAGGLTLVDDVDSSTEAAQISLSTGSTRCGARAGRRCVAAGSVPRRGAPAEDLRHGSPGARLPPATAGRRREGGALRKHAAANGLAVGGDVIGLPAHPLPRDMRTLTAALDALDASRWRTSGR